MKITFKKLKTAFKILGYNYFYEDFLCKNKAMYPIVVNFPITGKCNMKCIMCNVWKKENQHSHELTAKEIGEIFSTELFKKVKHVGLSGGEPFSRQDIDEIVIKIIENKPNLKSISIISNGTLTERIKDKLCKIDDICNENNVNFSISFSIDGVENIHNAVRGNNNSYSNLIKTLEYISQTDLYDKISLCCTISKYNINDLYDVLQFAKEKKLYIKFRVATEIKRLYNSELKDNFNLSRDEKIKVAKFYDKLVSHYEKNRHQKLYYKAVKEQLLHSSKRMLGCDWKNKGISLDAEGNLYYCFVKSPKVCNLLEEDGYSAYRNNIKLRKEIINNNCDSCIHDYVGNIDLKFIFKLTVNKFKGKTSKVCNLTKIKYVDTMIYNLINTKEKISLDKPKNNIFITGWYGTETTGDKAILAGIIDRMKLFNPRAKFIVSSIIPYYTEETLKELGYDDIEIVGRNTQDENEAIKNSDLVIMGGGPLMDIEETIDIMWTFVKAIKAGVPTCVYSCGLGPLNIEKYRNVVSNILKLSCYTYTRDENSLTSYSNLVKDINIESNIDPAVAYLHKYYDSCKKLDKKVLACIRDWPQNYSKISNAKEFEKLKQLYIKKLCSGFRLLIDNGYSIDFFPMNTFYIGDDDRDYYKVIKEELKGYEEKIHFYDKEYSTIETVDIFKEHSLIIGMRFHSVVFGNSLGIPTLAIDYDSNKGKVYGFMKTIGLEENFISINDIIKSDILINKIQELNIDKTMKRLNYFHENVNSFIDEPCTKIFNIKKSSN